MLVATSTIVGALACQKNSFLKSFQTVVVSCKEYEPILTSKDKQSKGKKREDKDQTPKEKLYAVELEDTILFPEGGGQPYDTGSIVLPDDSKVDVKQVLRKELTAVHVVPEAVQPGCKVILNLNWNRRIDIMQQHTGQHLISAVFDTYNLETLSWSMGDMINYIELPQKVDDNVIEEVSQKVNDLILENIPITVTTPDEHGEEIDTTHILEDYDLSKGVVRIVKIGNLDANPCCGTHLTSTGQIQAVSFLHQVNIRGGNSRLHFICGSRVSKQLANYHKLLKEVLGSTLSCQIEEVNTKVTELNANYRKSQSRESALLKQLANILAVEIFTKFKNSEGSIATVYREDNGPEYLQLFQKELTTLINSNKDSGVNINDKFTVVLLNGDYKSGTGGMVKILGPRAEEIQAELKKLITNMKGGGKGASFQGKVTKYEKGEVESVLRYLELLEIE